jgi:hypothetical protein
MKVGSGSGVMSDEGRKGTDVGFSVGRFFGGEEVSGQESGVRFRRTEFGLITASGRGRESQCGIAAILAAAAVTGAPSG